MLNRLISTAALTLLLLHGQPAHAAGDLLPSETTVLIGAAMAANPGAPRRSLTEPLVARMQSGEFADIENFYVGEVHFLNLDPEPARDVYWEYRQREDDIGRVANQRLMVIRINAFQMLDALLEKDIPGYRQRFGVSAHDRYGMTFPLTRTAQLMLQQGDADAALELIANHVREHDKFDAPYTAYRLPGQFLETAQGIGRGDEFAELIAWVRRGLNDAINKRLASKAPAIDTAAPITGHVFSSLFVDRGLSYHAWTAEMMTLRDELAQ